MWSEWIPYIARWSEWIPYIATRSEWIPCVTTWSGCPTICHINLCGLTICHINPCGLHGQCVSVCPSMWPTCLSIYCPCGQHVSAYIVSAHAVHMVIVSHNISRQSILSTWPVCITIDCPWVRVPHNTRYQSKRLIYCPCGQRVSQYIAQIRARWSVCIAICCIRPCCPHGQYVSPCVVRVVGMSHYVLHVWSEWIPYIACVVRVSRHILYNPCCLDGQYVSLYIAPHDQNRSHILPVWSEWIPYIACVVRVSRHILYQPMLSGWSVCLTIYCSA